MLIITTVLQLGDPAFVRDPAFNRENTVLELTAIVVSF